MVVLASEKDIQIDSNLEVFHPNPSKKPIATTQSTQDDNIVLEQTSEKASEDAGPEAEPYSIYTTNQKRAIILAA